MRTKDSADYFDGKYTSTYSFVEYMGLEQEANELFGNDWEAEDDVNQIYNLIEYLQPNNAKYIDVDCPRDKIIVKFKEEAYIIDMLFLELEHIGITLSEWFPDYNHDIGDLEYLKDFDRTNHKKELLKQIIKKRYE